MKKQDSQAETSDRQTDRQTGINISDVLSQPSRVQPQKSVLLNGPAALYGQLVVLTQIVCGANGFSGRGNGTIRASSVLINLLASGRRVLIGRNIDPIDLNIYLDRWMDRESNIFSYQSRQKTQNPLANQGGVGAGSAG